MRREVPLQLWQRDRGDEVIQLANILVPSVIRLFLTAQCFVTLFSLKGGISLALGVLPQIPSDL